MSRSAAKRLRRHRQATLGGAAALAALGVAGPAQAATFTVTSTADDGTGSLRAAIDAANASADADVITFASGVTGTITLASPLPQADAPIAVDGPGSGALTIDGVPEAPVLLASAGGSPVDGTSVRVRGLTLTGGAQGLVSTGAALDASDLVVRGNGLGPVSDQFGRGGVLAFGSQTGGLSFDDVSVVGNGAGDGFPVSGLVAFGRDVVVRDSEVRDTVAAPETSSAYVGAFLLGEAGAEVERSVVAGNVSNGGPAGLVVSTAVTGPTGATGTASVTGTTVVDNASSEAAAGLLLVGKYASGQTTGSQLTTVSGSTVARNAGQGGAGIQASRSAVTLVSTAVGGNRSFPDNADLSGDGTFTASRSLVSVPGTFDLGQGAITGVDPGLRPLGQYEGDRVSAPPAAGSPLLDAGLAAGAATDGRGLARTVDLAGIANAADGTDIGAAEASSVPTEAAEVLPSGLPGNPEAPVPATVTTTTQAPAPPPVVVQAPGGSQTTLPPRVLPRSFVGGVAFSRGRGRGTVQAVVPSAGRLTITGKGLTKATRTVEGAGVVSVKVKLTKKAAKQLRRTRKGLVRSLKLTFTPTSGPAVRKTVKLRFLP